MWHIVAGAFKNHLHCQFIKNHTPCLSILPNNKDAFTRLPEIRVFRPTKPKVVVYFKKPNDIQRVIADFFIDLRA